MKFMVKVGKAFELSLETDSLKSEKKSKNSLDKVVAAVIVTVAVSLVSATAYGAVSGDYMVLENVVETIFKALKVVLETAYVKGH